MGIVHWFPTLQTHTIPLTTKKQLLVVPTHPNSSLFQTAASGVFYSSLDAHRAASLLRSCSPQHNVLTVSACDAPKVTPLSFSCDELTNNPKLYIMIQQLSASEKSWL